MPKHVTVDEKGPSINLEDLYGKPSDDKKSIRRGTFIPQHVYDEEDASGDVRVSKFVHIDDATGHIFKYTAAKHKSVVRRSVRHFLTSSRYIGEWNALGLAGQGVYRFPHGVTYDGTFNPKGEFHGKGRLTYPNGTKFESMWKNGKLMGEPVFLTTKGTAMDKIYCQMPDRRFQIEMEKDFNSAGQEYQTNEPPPARTIPPNCYDTGEDFYDVRRKVMIPYVRRLMTDVSEDVTLIGEDFLQLRRPTKDDKNIVQLLTSKAAMRDEGPPTSIPSKAKEDWIVRNCRHAWDEATGYRKELYENWTYGAKYERLRLASESLNMFKTRQHTEEDDQGPDDDLNLFITQADAHEHSRTFSTTPLTPPPKVRFKSFGKRSNWKL